MAELEYQDVSKTEGVAALILYSLCCLIRWCPRRQNFDVYDGEETVRVRLHVYGTCRKMKDAFILPSTR